MQNNRDELWDVLKGIGIILVILGHMGLWNEFIYSFHMPLFFFLSGVLYKNRTCKELISYIKLRLLIPYLIWSVGLTLIAYFAASLWRNGILDKFSRLKEAFINIFLGGGPLNVIEVCPAIWYLTATIIVLIIYSIINRIKKVRYKNAVIMICALLGVVLAINGEMGLFNIVAALLAVPFWHAGRCFRDRKYILDNGLLYFFRGGVFTAANILLTKINGRVHMYRGILGKSFLLFYINAFCGIAMCVCIAYIIKKLHLKYICRILAILGKRTLGILCIHMILIYGFKLIFFNDFILFLCVLLISYSVAVIWDRVYCRILNTLINC